MPIISVHLQQFVALAVRKFGERLCHLNSGGVLQMNNMLIASTKLIRVQLLHYLLHCAQIVRGAAH